MTVKKVAMSGQINNKNEKGDKTANKKLSSTGRSSISKPVVRRSSAKYSHIQAKVQTRVSSLLFHTKVQLVPINSL